MSVFTFQPFLGIEGRHNFIPNPKARNDLTGFTAVALSGTGHTVTMVPAPYLGGPVLPAQITTAVKWTCGTNIATGWYGPRYTQGYVVAGNTYTFSVYALQNIGTRNIELRVLWRDASGAAISETNGGSLTSLAANTWTRLSLTATAPAGAAQAFLDVRCVDSVSVGGGVYATGYLMEQGTTLGTFFDGDTPNTTTINYRWSGTGNASSSGIWTPYYVQGDSGSEQIIPTFGPVGPTEWAFEASTLVHRALDDPSRTWQTLRRGRQRSGEFVLFFDTLVEARRAAVHFADPMKITGPNGEFNWATAQSFTFDGDGIGDFRVRFVVPDGERVILAPVEGDMLNSTGTEWLWQVVVPWVEVLS